jgi:hypothetical protein
MQDMLLLMGPPASIFYFVAFPDQFKELVAWVVAASSRADDSKEETKGFPQ